MLDLHAEGSIGPLAGWLTRYQDPFHQSQRRFAYEGERGTCCWWGRISTGVFETALEFCALDVVTVGVCSAIAWPLARYRHVFPLLGLLAFIAAESVILTIPVLLHWNVGHWNWTGKVASIGSA